MTFLFYINKLWLTTISFFQLWGLKLSSIFCIWFLPAQESALLLLFFILIDTITGIWFSIEKGVSFKSKGLVQTIKKIILYFIYCLVCHSFQVNFLKDTFNVFKLLLAIPIIREFTSIVENISGITGVNIITKFKEVIDKTFDKWTNNNIPNNGGGEAV